MGYLPKPLESLSIGLAIGSGVWLLIEITLEKIEERRDPPPSRLESDAE